MRSGERQAEIVSQIRSQVNQIQKQTSQVQKTIQKKPSVVIQSSKRVASNKNKNKNKKNKKYKKNKMGRLTDSQLFFYLFLIL